MSRINWSSNCPKWQARLDAARIRGDFSPDDERAAMNFATCAIDERVRELNPRYTYTDGNWKTYFQDPQTALDLGSEFCGKVGPANMGGDIKEAQRVLNLIKRLK